MKRFGLMLLAAVGLGSHAAVVTWDSDPASPGAQDGAGTWDAAGTNWWDGAANTNWSDGTPDRAIIGAAAGAAGVLSLDGARTAAGLRLAPPGSGSYTLTNGALALGSAGLVFSPAGAPALPLDGISTAALAQVLSACSLRRMAASYAGPAISVRRTSDNTTQDVSFTASGELDTAALLGFVGAADGVVVRVHAQAGAVSVVLNRGSPRIVIGGVLQTWPHGQPRIVQGSADGLRTSGLTNLFAGGGGTVCYAVSKDNLAGGRTVTGTSGNWLAFHWSNGEGGLHFNGNPNTLPAGNLTTERKLWSFAADTNSVQVYRNGAQFNTFNTPSLTSPGELDLNGVGAFSEPSSSSFGELLLFGAKLSTGDLAAVYRSQAHYHTTDYAGPAQSLALQSPVTLAAAQTWVIPGGAALTVGANLDNGGYPLAVESSGTTTIHGALSGTGGLVKTLAGSLHLTGTAATTLSGRMVLDNGNLIFGKTGGAVAVAPGAVVQLGQGTLYQPNLRMAAGQQFGPGALMVFSNASGNWTRFDLQGTTQTLAGLQGTAGGGIVQNERFGAGGTVGPATLILSNNADYSFTGYMRDRDAGAGTWLLSLVKTGGGTQTIAGANLTYTGPTTVEAGLLRIFDASAFASSVSNGAQVELGGNANGYSRMTRPAAGPGTWVVTGTGAGTVYQNRAGFATAAAAAGTATGALVVTATGKLWFEAFAGQNPTWGTAQPVDLTAAGSRLYVYGNAGQTIALGSLRGGGGVDFYDGGGGKSLTLSIGGDDTDQTYGGAIQNTGTSSGPTVLGLTKRGAGTQTLTGTNTYSGVTTVSGGRLALAASASLSNSALITVSPGAVFDVSAAGLLVLNTNQALGGGGAVLGSVIAQAGSRLAPGADALGGPAGTLSITGSVGLHAASTNVFHLSGVTNAGGGFNDLVAITGDLEPSNSVVRLEFDQPPTNGTYRLFTYTGGKVGSFNPSPVASLGRKGAYVDEATPGQVNLVVTGAYGNLVWLPQTNASWDVVVNNWSNTATAALDLFTTLDEVTFNEAGAYSNLVTIPAAVNPSRVTVAGASNYTFAGAGGLAGAASLVKAGGGTLLVLNTNIHVGETVVSNGVLQVGDGGFAGALSGAGVIRVESGGTLLNFRGDHYTANLTLTRSVAGPGSWIVRGTGGSLTSDYIVTGSQTGFTGSLTIDKARFQADAVTDAGYASINVLTGGQFWCWSGATYSNALTLAGQGWVEGTLFGALRLQLGATYAGPVTLANGARIGAISSQNLVSGNIAGGYDLEGYCYDANSRLVLSGNNTFNDLRLINYWTYITSPQAAGTGRVVMVGGGGLSALQNDLTITNNLRAEGTIHIGYHPTTAEMRPINWRGDWDLNGAGRDCNLFNTTTVYGAIGGTNGGLYKYATGKLVLRGTNTFSNAGASLAVSPAGSVLALEGESINTCSGTVVWNGAGGELAVSNNAVLEATQFFLGNGGAGRWGEFNQYGGLVRLNSLDATRVLVIGEHGGATSYVNLYGGTLSVTNGTGRTYIGWDGGGLLRIHGGLALLKTIRADGTQAGIDLDGGELRVGTGGIDWLSGPQPAINLGGGLLSAMANWASSIPMALNGTNGNTQVNGLGFTIALSGTLTGTGRLDKVGTGTLALNGAYSAGSVTVGGGTLGGTGTLSAAVAVSAGAVVQPGYLLGADPLAVSSITFAANAQFNPLANGTGAVLRVTATNGLAVPAGGTVATVNVLNATLTAGTFTVLDYAGAIQGGAVTNLVLGAVPPHSTMYLTNNAANTSIDLVVVTAGEPIKWVGNVNGNWSIDAPTNWVTTVGGVPTAYLQPGAVGDALEFDDTAAGNFSITLLTNVAPSSLFITNDLNDYTVGGSFGIGGSVALRKYGAAVFTLASSNSYSGGTLIAGGALRLADGGAPGSGAITNQAALVFERSDTSTLANAISGIGQVIKGGTGTVTLTSNPTYSGRTTVSNGTLALLHPTAFVSPSALEAGGTLRVENAGTLTVGAAPSIALNGGTLSYVAAGNNWTVWNGPVTNAGNSTISLAAGGAGTSGLFLDGGLKGSGTVTVSSVSAGVGLNLRNNNTSFAGTLIVNGAASATAGVGSGLGVGGCTIGLQNADITLNGTMELLSEGVGWANTASGAFALGALNGTGVMVGNHTAAGVTTVTLGNTGSPGLFAGEIANGVGNIVHLVKVGAGTQVLTGPNTYTGNTTINGGVLQVGAGGTNGVLGGGAVVNSATLVFDRSDSVALGAVLSGGGQLIKSGAGALALHGLSTNTGLTTVSNGTLLVHGRLGGPVMVDLAATLGGTGVVAGAVTQDGIIAPGASIGTLTISNQVNANATAVYRFELGGTNAPTDYDQLVVSDVHTLQGTLEVIVTNGYAPASGDRLNIMTNSGPGGLLFGTFTGLSAPALPAGLGWEVQYVGTESASLVVTGTVAGGLSAYEQWAQSITNPALRGEQADADGDGYANLLEYSQGTDATNSADSAKLSLVRTNGQFLVLFNRVNSATDIVYEVEGAYAPTNNATWLGIATNAIGSWGSSTNVNDNNTAAVHRVLVTDLLLGTNRSLRLKVTRP